MNKLTYYQTYLVCSEIISLRISAGNAAKNDGSIPSGTSMSPRIARIAGSILSLTMLTTTSASFSTPSAPAA